MIRLLAFNAALYGITALMCFLMLWALILPRSWMLLLIHLWLRQVELIERYIGGIRWQVIGRENIPAGACIIAAKHQSAWETFKLHLLLGDPAIVLKKELLNIPLWGWYLRRSGMIPIDRSARGKAVFKMVEVAKKAVEQGRKIVIFPQGTRTAPGEQRPYKTGVATLYQELHIPVVPMALNSGLLWPRHSFRKKPGLITVEFLPAIEPGMPRAAMMDRLKTDLETACDRLLKI